MSVAIVDCGEKLPSNQRQSIDALAALPWQSWPSGSREQLLELSSTGVEAKSLFGDYGIYDHSTLGIHYSIPTPRASIGHGGFSKVWGATALPFPQGAWPEVGGQILHEIAQSINTLAMGIGIAGEPGPVDELYSRPTYTHALPSSSALTSLVRSASFLEWTQMGAPRGIMLPRLALAEGAPVDEPMRGCTQCGLCQVGCVYGHIWDSEKLVHDFLERSSTSTYVKAIALKLESDSSSAVKILARTRPEGGVREVFAKRVLVAAGPISTAALLLRSNIVKGHIDLLDSQTFFVGGWSNAGLSISSPTTTLTEALSVAPTGLGDSHSHIQLYGPSDYLRRRIFSSSRFLSRVPLSAQLALFPHLAVGLGYLDSSESSRLRIYLRADGVPSASTCGKPNENAVSLAVDAHRENMAGIGIRLVGASVRILPVGGGNHLGSSLPMRLDDTSRDDKRLWSDTLGRPFGEGRIHVIDTSVLPKVPAGPITLMAMGNAHRIARSIVEVS